ncbi:MULTISPECIES: MBL fold metallo-hydrolase [Nocardia]|uniref:MBL fold metallo-hydrolase n=1 Tax=Nocardia TaxID=1817 RepID=UPI000BF20A52|nr:MULTISPECIES: MBL fold metallo-hydrolase [Nocardia]MBF6184759.1 MBL fold metallo-hydrolase [Nocardia farcinica]MBF6310603.1 MBL fold metallo-hydrolase [Nocardia farcinica]MBF6405577.1 MBL fold metallo-hydrolase [Nocardia farcinica]PEH75250.1 MBL fold metallo-hydrolase [Nocardia sp. FDAARGOS_372]UEX24802.1 MBL fold metallo-hydrolase [Nocardia farcinica]
MLTPNVADGVHLPAHAAVNVYLVEDEDGVTLVDTGLPATYPRIRRALRAIGRDTRDVRAVVLTHAHFDHVGSARRIHRDWQLPIRTHTAERFLAAHPYRYRHERARLRYPLRYPKSVLVLARMAAAGALFVRGTPEVTCFDDGAELDVPGRPRVVFTPGHTLGHCALHLPGRDTVLSGDALVTLDPYTGATGPQIVSGAATADSTQALSSLTALAATGARTVLPGHGAPWFDGVAAAAELALRAGPS